MSQRGRRPRFPLPRTGPPLVRRAAGTDPGLTSEIILAERIDINNDGKPEVIVSFTSATGRISTWLFRWTGNELVSIGPVTAIDGDTATLLNDALFVDLDGDGALDIVNGADPDDHDLLMQVYKMQNGSYSLSKSVNFFGTYVRHNGQPETVENSFSVTNPQGLYTLRIINGAGSGNRVSSASVSLN
jgi:hypothetical protein